MITDTCFIKPELNGRCYNFHINSEESLCVSMDNYGTQPIHIIAEAGELNKLPKELVTYKVLISGDNYGNGAVHKSAKTGYLDQIPEELLPKLLTVCNHNEQTPAHIAAFNGFLLQIPISLITVDLLKLSGRSCGSVACCALKSPKKHQLSSLLERLQRQHMGAEKLFEISKIIIKSLEEHDKSLVLL